MKKFAKEATLASLFLVVAGLLASCAASSEESRGLGDMLREVRLIEATATYPWPAAFIWAVVAWVAILILANVPVKWAKPKAGSEARPTFLEILQDVFGGTEKGRRITARVLAVVVYVALVLAIRGLVDFLPGQERHGRPEPHPPPEPGPAGEGRPGEEPSHGEEPHPPEPGPE
ncbi:MAG: hypothetical protein JSU81_11655 [Candidatus Coatesbacteria bacterium]|nr:MAG: hypothetical protein JSU81_11655 [Candidatus Coatesbacteria bacterium]